MCCASARRYAGALLHADRAGLALATLGVERKALDWGWLDGRPVAVDYANLDEG
jgi:hypothetical protein